MVIDIKNFLDLAKKADLIIFEGKIFQDFYVDSHEDKLVLKSQNQNICLQLNQIKKITFDEESLDYTIYLKDSKTIHIALICLVAIDPDEKYQSCKEIFFELRPY